MFDSVQNKCNVGYAFINMSSPSHVVSFYKVLFCNLFADTILVMTTFLNAYRSEREYV